MGAHALLSPSAAKRWVTCPGSVRLHKGLPEEKPSVYAAEGTIAHELAELSLRKPGVNIEKLLPEVKGSTVEMASYIKLYRDFVLSEHSSASNLLIETKVTLKSYGLDQCWGTGDAIIIKPYKGVHIIDLKYGKGLAVYPKDNFQMMIYALGALALEPEAPEITMSIFQPRLSTKPNTYAVTAEYLKQWCIDILRPAAQQALSDDGPLNPSKEACRWCRVKATCPELKRQALSLFGIDSKTVPPVDTVQNKAAQNMDMHELSNALELFKIFDMWKKAVEKVAHERLLDGKDIPGFKLVEKQSARAWVNEADAVKILKTVLPEESFISYKLITPTQALKLVDKDVKDKIESCCQRGEPSLSIKPAHAKGKAYNKTAEAQKGFGTKIKIEEM